MQQQQSGALERRSDRPCTSAKRPRPTRTGSHASSRSARSTRRASAATVARARRCAAPWRACGEAAAAPKPHVCTAYRSQRLAQRRRAEAPRRSPGRRSKSADESEPLMTACTASVSATSRRRNGRRTHLRGGDAPGVARSSVAARRAGSSVRRSERGRRCCTPLSETGCACCATRSAHSWWSSGRAVLRCCSACFAAVSKRARRHLQQPRSEAVSARARRPAAAAAPS